MGRKNRKRKLPEWRTRTPLRIESELRHCSSGKHCFHTEARAQLAAMKYEQEHQKEQKVYRCPRCHSWHLTTKY